MKFRFKAGAGACIQAVLAALVILIPTVLLPVCTAQMETASGAMAPMRCHYLKMASVSVGILLAAMAVIRLFANDVSAAQCLKLTQAAGGLVVSLLPGVLIGACKNAAMHCRMLTSPALMVTGGLVLVCALVDFVIGDCRARKTK